MQFKENSFKPYPSWKESTSHQKGKTEKKHLTSKVRAGIGDIPHEICMSPKTGDTYGRKLPLPTINFYVIFQFSIVFRGQFTRRVFQTSNLPTWVSRWKFGQNGSKAWNNKELVVNWITRSWGDTLKHHFQFWRLISKTQPLGMVSYDMVSPRFQHGFFA